MQQRIEIRSECEPDHRARHLANAAEWRRRYFECRAQRAPECDPSAIWRMVGRELALANATFADLGRDTGL